MTFVQPVFEFQSIQGAIMPIRNMKQTIQQSNAVTVGKQSLAKKQEDDKPKPKKDKDK
jgi:hypothetical protein